MVTHPSTFYSVIVINTHTAASSEGAGALPTSECGYLIRWATRVSQEAEGVPRPPATFTWRRKGMWIDYRLHIHLIYIYRFLFSHAHSVAIAHSHIFIPFALIYFFVYNVTKMVTGLKLQSPEEKKNKFKRNQTENLEEGERMVRPGELGRGEVGRRGFWAGCRFCCPSLTVAAGGTQSARCSNIKEEAVEAPSP